MKELLSLVARLSLETAMIIWCVAVGSTTIISAYKSFLGTNPEGWKWIMPFGGGLVLSMIIFSIARRRLLKKLEQARKKSEHVARELRKRVTPLQQKVYEAFANFMSSVSEGHHEDAEKYMEKVKRLNSIIDTIVAEQYMDEESKGDLKIRGGEGDECQES